MVRYEGRDRMHELAARTAQTHCFDHREIARQKKLLSYAYDIRVAWTSIIGRNPAALPDQPPPRD